MSRVITFDKALSKEILGGLGFGVDDDNYVVEKSAPYERVMTPEGDEVTLDSFAGVKGGSVIFITKDLPSLIKHVNDGK